MRGKQLMFISDAYGLNPQAKLQSPGVVILQVSLTGDI